MFISIIFISCSSNDDENTELDQTFLEKYHNTVWLQQGTTNITVYRYFENNLDSAVISIYNGASACFQIGEYHLTNAEILENSTNKLEIRFTYSSDEYEINTFTFSNGTMTYSWFEYYFGGITEVDHNLVATPLSLDEINFCN